MDKSKREFCKKYFLQQAVNIAAGFRDGVRAAKEKEDFESFFDSYESSYSLTLAYPDDILMEAKRDIFGISCNIYNLTVSLI